MEIPFTSSTRVAPCGHKMRSRGSWLTSWQMSLQMQIFGATDTGERMHTGRNNPRAWVGILWTTIGPVGLLIGLLLLLVALHAADASEIAKDTKVFLDS